MKQYKAYLIDLDGTIFRGNDVIDGALDFVQLLVKQKIPYLYLTNNSLRTPVAVAEKLTALGVPATPAHVFTSAMATANYLKEIQQDAKIYCIGEEGIRQALLEKGFTLQTKNPDYVVIGIDREINYRKLADACLAVRAGAKLIATNPDIAFPSEEGFLPGNGALTAVVETSTQTKAQFIGKPETIIMEQALKVLQLQKSEVVMVGDYYQTDVLAGIRSGMDTILVLTGVTQRKDLDKVDLHPTHVIENLRSWRF